MIWSAPPVSTARRWPTWSPACSPRACWSANARPPTPAPTPCASPPPAAAPWPRVPPPPPAPTPGSWRCSPPSAAATSSRTSPPWPPPPTPRPPSSRRRPPSRRKRRKRRKSRSPRTSAPRAGGVARYRALLPGFLQQRLGVGGGDPAQLGALGPDDPAGIDGVGLRDAGSSEIHARPAVGVEQHLGVRIAEPPQKGLRRLRLVLVGDADDPHALGLEGHQGRRFLHARRAPRSVEIDQGRSPDQRADRRRAAGQAGKDDGRGRMADHRHRLDLRRPVQGLSLIHISEP